MFHFYATFYHIKLQGNLSIVLHRMSGGSRQHGNSNQAGYYNREADTNQDSNSSDRWQLFSPLARQDDTQRNRFVMLLIVPLVIMLVIFFYCERALI